MFFSEKQSFQNQDVTDAVTQKIASQQRHIKQPPEVLCKKKKRFLRNFAEFTGKDLCQSFFFNKDAGLRPVTLLKKGL